MHIYDSIVIGGGQAGLVAGYHLKRKGLSFLILESEPKALGSWPKYYDSLKLFSPARFSSLPGLKFRSTTYPKRDEVIDYLKQYQQHFHLPVQTNENIISVMRENGIFTLYSTIGSTFRTKTIINATGNFHRPYTPEISGHESFLGNCLHSSEYRNPDSFKNQRIIVVGRGNSAVQIAVELSEVSTVSLAVLKPVQFTKQKVGGVDVHFWLRMIGLDTFPFWRFGLNAPNPSAVMDLDQYKMKLDAGNPAQKKMFTSFYSDGVIWPDGAREKIDSIIFATGYKPNMPHFQALGATHAGGDAIHQAGVSEVVPGLFFVGLYGQRSFASATMRGVGPDAKYVVNKLVKYLKKK
ncbi:flavin-containing monooxygenase [Paenibacillus sp. strain BS8-2]